MEENNKIIAAILTVALHSSQVRGDSKSPDDLDTSQVLNDYHHFLSELERGDKIPSAAQPILDVGRRHQQNKS
jgi:hypothetical protein